MSITFSKEACNQLISYSKESSEKLQHNASIMDNQVNSQFAGLQDPTFKKYMELSEKMQDYLRQIGQKMDAISDYCERVKRWIDEYSEI